MLTDIWQIQLTIDICGALLLTTEKRPDGPKNKDVDSFCPIKVRFSLRIVRSTQKCHISLIITAWTIHIKALCHRSVIWYLKPNSIVNLRDDRILKAVVSFHRIDSEMAFERHRSRLPINDVNTVLALKKAPCFVPWSKGVFQQIWPRRFWCGTLSHGYFSIHMQSFWRSSFQYFDRLSGWEGMFQCCTRANRSLCAGELWLIQTPFKQRLKLTWEVLELFHSRIEKKEFLLY